MSSYEREARSLGYALVAGVDEAGRGSLFGPVHAAAVVLSPERPVCGLRDSKELTALERERLAAQIRRAAVCWAVAQVDAFLIDRINIYQASCLAMLRAIARLDPQPDYLLIDAVRLPLDLPQNPLIHGDARSQAIAAASILAKVARDGSMNDWGRVYPQYGLARHKGYTTPEHLNALCRFGPSPQHRFTFEPVREACPRPLRREAAQFPWLPAASVEPAPAVPGRAAWA